MISDQDLLEQISQGNEIAFKTLYERYWKNIHQLACRILMDKKMAEDIVQDVFVSLWIKRNALEIRNLRAYIYQATKLSCFEQLRKTKIHETFLDRAQIVLQSKDHEDNVNLEDTRFRINRSVSALPDKTKKIFKLSRERSLSNHQIAEELNISPKTVEYHISVSLKHLRRNLAQFFF